MPVMRVTGTILRDTDPRLSRSRLDEEAAHAVREQLLNMS